MHRVALAAVVAVYVALFARTVGYDYVWDDVHTLRTSDFFDQPIVDQLRVTEGQRTDPTVRSLRGITLGHDSYRPLALLSQDIDVRLFGRDRPGPMHVHALVLGALAILLAYALARRLLDSPRAGVAVAAIFALHPLHVEPFAYISARADLVAGLCAMAALALAVELAPPGRDARSRRARALLATGAGVAFLASLFAKESTIGLPVVVLLFAVAVGRVRPWASAILAMVGAIVVYLALRSLLIPGVTAAAGGGAWLAAERLPALATQYARSFALPLDISIARLPHVPIAVGWLVAAAVVGGGVLAWRARRWSQPLALALAALASSAILVGPSAVAVATLGALADRYAYLSVLMLAIAAVIAARAAFARGGPLGRGALALAVLWGLLCGFVTLREIPFWASNERLYAHAVEAEPGSALAIYRVAVLRIDAGRWADAAALLEAAAQLDPNNDRVLNNLGVSYMNLGRLDDADATLRRALAASHDMAFRAWHNLALVQRARGLPADACASDRRALAIDPAYARAREDLARNCGQ